MVQIINEEPSSKGLAGRGVANALMGGLKGYLENQQGQRQQQQMSQQMQQENEAVKQLTGKDISGVRDPKMRQAVLQMALTGQNEMMKKSGELQSKQREKLAPYMAGLETIGEMRNIKNKGNLGRGSSVLGMFNEDVRRDRAQYSQLGKSLISLASTIPIRNQKEFETLAGDLYDPSLSEAELEGVLDAMESIIRRSMGPGEEEQGFEPEMRQPMAKEKPKQKPPLSSFHR